MIFNKLFNVKFGKSLLLKTIVVNILHTMTYPLWNICRSFCSFERWREWAWTWNCRKKKKLVSGFVTSTFHHHKKEIFSAILKGCTDWSSVTRHIINTRDTTSEALSDGLYVAPAIETKDYHASLNKNSWFYVFNYQSKYGDYKRVSKLMA